MKTISFQHLNTQGKIAICAEIHSILSQYYPKSEYALTEANKASGTRFYKKLITDFDGMGLVGSECVMLYKYVTIFNPHDTIGEFMRVKNISHDPVGNCLFIDFLVANLKNTNNSGPLKEILFQKNIDFCMMARRGTIYILTKEELKARAEKLESFLIS